jgi:HPt (histidine-containing phosphotransfer) domain-containing protein
MIMSMPGHSGPVSWDTDGLLMRLGGDAALAAECTEIFCLDAARRLDALRTHCAAGELPEVIRQLHSLKGAAGTAGAVAFQHAAGDAEQAAHGGDLASVTTLADVMDEELARIRRAVLTFRTAA